VKITTVYHGFLGMVIFFIPWARARWCPIVSILACSLLRLLMSVLGFSVLTSTIHLIATIIAPFTIIPLHQMYFQYEKSISASIVFRLAFVGILLTHIIDSRHPYSHRLCRKTNYLMRISFM